MVSEANHLKILKYERCPLLFLKEWPQSYLGKALPKEDATKSLTQMNTVP